MGSTRSLAAGTLAGSMIFAALSSLTASAVAQDCEAISFIPSNVSNELYLDQVYPYTVHSGPAHFVHYSALKALAADFDKVSGGHNEIVVGGNGYVYPVQVFWFDSSWQIATCADHPVDHDSSGKGTTGCYDIEIADINEDTWPDITVARRLPDVDPDPLSNIDTEHGHRSTIFLNAGASAPSGATACTYEYFPTSQAVKIPIPVGSDSIPHGDTFTLAYGQVTRVETGSAPNHLDLVTSGNNYGVRYYVGHGDATFTYGMSNALGYVDPDDADPTMPTGYRDVELGDLDGDGDQDLFVTRSNIGYFPPAPSTNRPNTVWFNSGSDPYDPFVMSTQPALKLPGLDTITWVGDSGGCAPTASGTVQLVEKTMEAALSDLDVDGDLDVVCANFWGLNAAYLNDGHGYFGTQNTWAGSSDKNDGCAAVAFPAITPNWTGHSAFLMAFTNAAYSEAGLSSPFSCGDEDDYVFTVPGCVLNNSSGVSIADVTGDGLPDIAFSSRNDWEELAVTASPPFPYFDADTGNPVPHTYDYLFLSKVPGESLDYCTDVVERIGDPDDGTGYGKLLRIDTNRRFDWLDANFSNFSTATQSGSNDIYWGQSLASGVSCESEYGSNSMTLNSGESDEESSFTLHLDFAADYDFAGLPFQVIASASDTEGTMEYAGAELPIVEDGLTDLLLGAGGEYPGAVGVLDSSDATAKFDLSIPLELLGGSGLQVLIVVSDGSSTPAFVSNVVHVSPP